jgi:iron(III) transport system substrate-binding protein
MPPSRLILAALLGLLAACGDGRTPLVVYSPHGRDLLLLVERAYEAEHAGIDLRFLDMGSQEVLDRLRSERANPQADVWFGGPSTLFARGAELGLLEPFVPTWSAALPPDLRDRAGAYHALYLTPTLIVYNRDAVAEDAAPRDWDDLLDQRWRDRIIIRDPLASGTMRTIFGALISRSIDDSGTPEQGFAYLRALDAQTKEYVHSPALMHEKLIRQEGLLSLWEMTDILNLIARGAPLAYRFPESGAPVIEDAVALVAGAPHTDSARALVEWLGSKPALILAAREASRLPARPDLEPGDLPAWSKEVRAQLRPMPVDWLRLERDGADWMATWDQTIRGRSR